jgi:hypothetical protein
VAVVAAFLLIITSDYRIDDRVWNEAVKLRFTEWWREAIGHRGDYKARILDEHEREQ